MAVCDGGRLNRLPERRRCDFDLAKPNVRPTPIGLIAAAVAVAFSLPRDANQISVMQHVVDIRDANPRPDPHVGLRRMSSASMLLAYSIGSRSTPATATLMC